MRAQISNAVRSKKDDDEIAHLRTEFHIAKASEEIIAILDRLTEYQRHRVKQWVSGALFSHLANVPAVQQRIEQQTEADVRNRIAKDIEAHYGDLSYVMPKGRRDLTRKVAAYCARIARGDVR